MQIESAKARVETLGRDRIRTIMSGVGASAAFGVVAGLRTCVFSESRATGRNSRSRCGAEIGEELFLARFVRCLLNHGDEDGFEGARILQERGSITLEVGGFDDVLRCGSDEFETTNKHACGVVRRWIDVQRQHGIDKRAWNDIDEARALFEPRVFSAFEHGVGFVGEEALGNEDAFEDRGEGIERAIEGWRESRFVLKRAERLVTHLCTVALEEDYVRDYVGGSSF